MNSFLSWGVWCFCLPSSSLPFGFTFPPSFISSFIVYFSVLFFTIGVVLFYIFYSCAFTLNGPTFNFVYLFEERTRLKIFLQFPLFFCVIDFIYPDMFLHKLIFCCLVIRIAFIPNTIFSPLCIILNFKICDIDIFNQKNCPYW